MYASFLLCIIPTHHALITDDAFLTDTKKVHRNHPCTLIFHYEKPVRITS